MPARCSCDGPTLFRTELDVEIDDVFAEFDPVPVASASIASVYRARLPTAQPSRSKADGLESLNRLSRTFD